MTEDIEKLCLLALALLVSRQRALANGEPQPLWVSALRKPQVFDFFLVHGECRCVLDKRLQRALRASVLVIEEREFISPLMGLAAHLEILPADHSDDCVARLTPRFVELIGLEEGDEIYSFYSPLQVLFKPEHGFFLPHREPWHAYIGKVVASTIADSSRAISNSRTVVSWPGGSMELCDRGESYSLQIACPGEDIAVKVNDGGFEFRARGAFKGRIFPDLMKFCRSGAMPVGITAADEGGSSFRIRGG